MNKDYNYELNTIKTMKTYYHTGETHDVEFRIKQLKKLKQVIIEHEKEIVLALRNDLGRHEFETYVAEIASILSSISYMCRHLKRWSKVKKVKTPIHQIGAQSFIQPEPYGIVLVIGPFNYPFNLTIEPMVGAMAAGNCVVVKPSEQTPTVSKVIKKMLSQNFDREYIQVIEGEKEVTSSLINSPFDYIFFTGSVHVGKIVMEAASKNLVPVTLELGGKSPCIVHKDANIKVAAERIAFGKFFNVGQTCIAPDYIVVHKDIKQKFIHVMIETIKEFYSSDIKSNENYGRIVNERHTKRLTKIIENDCDKIIFGGDYSNKLKYIEPTILNNVTWDDECMKDELFGPIMPIMEYEDLNKVICMVNDRPKPLALYFFSQDKTLQKKILTQTSSGGTCINDTINHFVSHHLPFGGVGNAGMGSYHGYESYVTFSHMKSVMNKTTAFNIKLPLPPYSEKKLALVKKLFL